MLAVTTLNLRFGLADDGADSWHRRKSLFPDLLSRCSADFMGFQEANGFQIDFLDGLLKEHAYIGRRQPAPAFWQNNVIFYPKTWRCEHKEHFFLSATPDIPSRSPRSKWPRQCSWGRFRHGDAQLVCVNTHFDFDPAVQAASAVLIMQRLQHLPAELPVVLLGDFNADPDSPGYRIFTGQRQLPAVAGPFFRNAFEKPYPGTHHGFTGNSDGACIDWILYRGPLVPRGSRVVRDAIAGRFPSDHYPLHARFEISG